MAAASSLKASSFSCITADPNEDTLEDLAEKVFKLWKEKCRHFPSLTEARDWDVYLLSKFFGHYSMVFNVPGTTEGIVVHLVVVKDKSGKPQTQLALDKIDLKVFQEKYSEITQTKLGTIHYNAVDIIQKAFVKLREMGSYHSTLNNCQDYCQQLAKTFDGIDSFSTDGDMVVTGTTAVGAAAIIGVIGYGLYKLFKSDDKDSK